MSRKHVVVTGASTGIGLATTRLLASSGWDVIAGARNGADLDSLGKIEHVLPVKLDVTVDADIANLVSYLAGEGFDLHGLVNNAGIAEAGPLMDVSVEDLQWQMDVNLLGVHRVTTALFENLLSTGGRIVMMSSNSGFFAAPFFGPYNTSKFALEGYADSLRRELLFTEMKVILIEPGRIKTPIWDKGKAIIEKYKDKDSMFKDLALKIGEYAIEKGNSDGLDPMVVARLVKKALEAKKPKPRYMVAPNMLENYFLRVLPGRSVDSIIKKELKKLV